MTFLPCPRVLFFLSGSSSSISRSFSSRGYRIAVGEGRTTGGGGAGRADTGTGRVSATYPRGRQGFFLPLLPASATPSLANSEHGSRKERTCSPHGVDLPPVSPPPLLLLLPPPSSNILLLLLDRRTRGHHGDMRANAAASRARVYPPWEIAWEIPRALNVSPGRGRGRAAGGEAEGSAHRRINGRYRRR